MVDLATWNLSIPEGSPPKTIETPRLVDGFKDKYFSPDGSTVRFWAPVTGSKTENAIYPRSELRETYKDGTLRNWLYPEADNFLNATLTVNQVPSSGKVVIGQIHTKDSNKPMVKLEYQYKDANNLGDIVAKVRMRPDDSKARVITVASGVKISQAFSYRIHLDRTGDLGITAAGRSWYTTISSTWRVKPLYFKAGVYVQDNSGYTSEGGKVTFSKLDIDHNT